MLRIEPPGPVCRKPVVDSAGNRVGTVTNAGDGNPRVSVSADAPAETLDALDWAVGDDVLLPDRLVADDADADDADADDADADDADADDADADDADADDADADDAVRLVV